MGKKSTCTKFHGVRALDLDLLYISFASGAITRFIQTGLWSYGSITAVTMLMFDNAKLEYELYSPLASKTTVKRLAERKKSQIRGNKGRATEHQTKHAMYRYLASHSLAN